MMEVKGERTEFLFFPANLVSYFVLAALMLRSLLPLDGNCCHFSKSLLCRMKLITGLVLQHHESCIEDHC